MLALIEGDEIGAPSPRAVPFGADSLQYHGGGGRQGGSKAALSASAAKAKAKAKAEADARANTEALTKSITERCVLLACHSSGVVCAALMLPD